MYDPLSTRYTFSCPTRGESRVLLHDFRELDRLPGRGASGRVPRPLRVRVRGRPRRSRGARRARLGAARARLGRVPEPDDGPARAGRGRVRRSRGAADRSGGVAVELLLLPGGATAAGVPLDVLAARARHTRKARSGSPSAARRVCVCRSTSSPRHTSTCRSTTTRPWASSSTCSATTRCERSRSSAPSSTRPRSTPGGSSCTDISTRVRDERAGAAVPITGARKR